MLPLLEIQCEPQSPDTQVCIYHTAPPSLFSNDLPSTNLVLQLPQWFSHHVLPFFQTCSDKRSFNESKQSPTTHYHFTAILYLCLEQAQPSPEMIAQGKVQCFNLIWWQLIRLTWPLINHFLCVLCTYSWATLISYSLPPLSWVAQQISVSAACVTDLMYCVVLCVYVCACGSAVPMAHQPPVAHCGTHDDDGWVTH